MEKKLLRAFAMVLEIQKSLDRHKNRLALAEEAVKELEESMDIWNKLGEKSKARKVYEKALGHLRESVFPVSHEISELESVLFLFKRDILHEAEDYPHYPFFEEYE